MRVLLLGASGTIGQATATALVESGHEVTSLVRQDVTGLPGQIEVGALTTARLAEASRGCDAVISCLASRTGVAADAWAVDHGANSQALQAAVAADVKRFVLLSAICVQKPKLAFQQAKLAFEAELRAAPVTWSIVRPTAFFKSLSGQVERLRKGKPFLLFGDGALTACKPISDRDTARYLVRCLEAPEMANAVLPVGGPGPAITPREQGAMLFDALGLPPTFKHVPVGLMSAIIAGLTPFGAVSRMAAEKAELARIGRYYATESMLIWDEIGGRYDADGTPEFGEDTLAAHYRKLAAGELEVDLGAHKMF